MIDSNSCQTTTPRFGEWQPIEAAPKDGTRIVLYNSRWEKLPIARWEMIDGDDGLFGAWQFDDSFLCLGVGDGVLGWNEDIEDGNMPTHWMPLPEPPK